MNQARKVTLLASLATTATAVGVWLTSVANPEGTEVASQVSLMPIPNL